MSDVLTVLGMINVGVAAFCLVRVFDAYEAVEVVVGLTFAVLNVIMAAYAFGWIEVTATFV